MGRTDLAFGGIRNLIKRVCTLFGCLGRRSHVRLKAIRHEKTCRERAALDHAAHLLDIVLDAGATACIRFAFGVFVHTARVLLHIDQLRQTEKLYAARRDFEPSGQCADNADTLCGALQEKVHWQHFKQSDQSAVPCVNDAAVYVCNRQTALQVIACGGEFLRALYAKNRVFYGHV